MAAQKSSTMNARHSRPAQPGTPGRRTNTTANQYFDIGKVGRKTGITLRDTGIRDDYGLEPMSGIFSSPGSAQQSSIFEDDGSADMEGLDSTMPEVEDTIRSRRVSRLPPARTTPPRRTNIAGSPRRQLSGKAQSQPPFGSPDEPYRRLNFGTNGIRTSIEKQSPFKPRHVLRRSSPGLGGLRENRPLPGRSSEVSNGSVRRQSQRQSIEQSSPQTRYLVDDEPLFVQQDEPLQYSTRDEIEGALDLAESMLHSSPGTARKRRRTGEPRISTSSPHYIPPVAPMIPPSGSQKRPRISDSYEEQTGHFASDVAPTSRRETNAAPTYDDQPIDDYGYDDADDYDDDVSVDLPSVIPSDDQDNDNVIEVSSASPSTDEEAHPNARKRKASPKKARVKINAPPPRRQRSESVTSESGSDAEMSRTKRSGSRSNVQLRATTPFEDAGQRTTRFGRPVMKPLDWWAGETLIWKNGEIDGVTRANSVEPERRVVNKKRNAHKKQTKKIKAGLDAINEQDEDMLPSDWEEDIGVLRGDVATWDPEKEVGDDNNIATEDIAFAASSIITRAVVGANFSYAKIQTLPFFGSGVVEIPPNGMKTVKNSRKMQMNFFVHKGKVRVTITTPTSSQQPEPVASSQFSITEGGAWVVPRGNNYTIENISSSNIAYIFFSQGCEVEIEREDESDG